MYGSVFDLTVCHEMVAFHDSTRQTFFDSYSRRFWRQGFVDGLLCKGRYLGSFINDNVSIIKVTDNLGNCPFLLQLGLMTTMKLRQDLGILFGLRCQTCNHISADSKCSSYLFVGLKGDIDFLQDLYLFLQKEWTTFFRSLSFPRSHFSFEVGNSNKFLFGIELVSSH
jgi:hypothetical protein